MDWQQLLVYLIVAAAALYLWRRSRRKSSAGCGGCGTAGGCGSSRTASTETPQEPELIQLELTPRKRA
ncbi:MAG: hypothetical protein K0Q72_532 [Armatimonadetes bacterium]|jgi:hypothetical protein|nr:hypothetical protein [Armatimonadota bacterium]